MSQHEKWYQFLAFDKKCQTLIKEACWFFTWGGEEDSSQVFVVGDLEDFSCDVHQPASHRRDPPEIQDPDKQFDGTPFRYKSSHFHV